MKIAKTAPRPVKSEATPKPDSKAKTPVARADHLDAKAAAPAAAQAHTPLPSAGLGFDATEVAAYDAANHALTGKYPTLDVVLKDPDRFVADMTARFDAQKKLTPANPYAFEYGDYALPVMKGVSAALGKEIDEVSAGKDHPGERAKGVAYLKELKADIDGHLASGTMSYRRTQELGYFASEALGLFDARKETLGQRAFLVIDRHLDGYTPKSLEAQISNYHRNAFTVFDTKTPVQGLAEVADTFDQAFFATDELEMLSLPTMEPLGLDIFFRLTDYNLFPVGIAADPIAADGFVRPGGDFWVHDLRHSSDMFGRRKVYESEHHMAEPQIRKLQKRIDVWRAELETQVAKIPDPNLRGAVTFMMFNYHHDRGRPMVPSSFVPESAGNVPKLLNMMERLSGQSSGFSGRQYVDLSYTWLRNFWLPKLDQERAILGDVKLGAPAQ